MIKLIFRLVMHPGAPSNLYNAFLRQENPRSEVHIGQFFWEPDEPAKISVAKMNELNVQVEFEYGPRQGS